MPVQVYLDFETRSFTNLKQSGLYVYAEDPTTEVLCLAYAINNGPVQLWHANRPGHPGKPLPTELFTVLERPGTLIEAHNANFERVIWRALLVPQGWPSIPDEAWRCSAAKAAAHNLPRALDNLGTALNLPIRKDTEGHKLMLKMCKPRKGSLKNALLWQEEPEDFTRLFRYCRQDVAVERAASLKLRELSPTEQEVWQEDLQMNERGITVDKPYIHKALNLISLETKRLNKELKEITRGQLTAASQRKRLLDWVNAIGIPLKDTTKDEIDKAIKREKANRMPMPIGIRVMYICKSVNRTSTSKYRAMNFRASKMDDRLRGTLLYHGAGTGRWAGAGVQPHNFPRGTTDDLHMDQACQDILMGDQDTLRLLYDDLMELLSSAARGALVAAKGHDLIVGDYASIEARVLAWLAGDERAIELFERGGDPYIDLATDIYKVAYEAVIKSQRQVGKQAELGLGFGMGWKKFKATCAKYGIEIESEFAEEVVDIYRDKHWPIVNLWTACNEAAFDAIENPGKICPAGKVKYTVKGDFLWCQLPSGRRLAYYKPRLELRETPWGEMRLAVTYMGMNSFTNQWERLSTYGGKLVENIVQATARDFMADAILRFRGTIYKLLLSVHDELIAEVPEGTGNVQEFEAMMSILPHWGIGCPVGAEGWRGKRYKK